MCIRDRSGRACVRRCGDPSARFSRPVAQRFEADDRAEPGHEEFVNAVFDPQEQVNGKQTELLGTDFTLAAGGPAAVHIGTGSGGSSSDLQWGEQKNKNRKMCIRDSSKEIRADYIY